MFSRSDMLTSVSIGCAYATTMHDLPQSILKQNMCGSKTAFHTLTQLLRGVVIVVGFKFPHIESWLKSVCFVLLNRWFIGDFFGSVSFSSWWNQAVNNPFIGWSITDPIGHCSTRTGPPIYNDPLIFSGAISMERWRCVDRLIWFLIGIDRILVGMIMVSLAVGCYCHTASRVLGILSFNLVFCSSEDTMQLYTCLSRFIFDMYHCMTCHLAGRSFQMTESRLVLVYSEYICSYISLKWGQRSLYQV